jgi:translation initiation factor IF-3
VAKDLKDVAVVEQPPRMEGRLMFMILAPTPKVAQKARELARQAAGKAKKAQSASAEKPAAASEEAEAPEATTESVEAPKAAKAAEPSTPGEPSPAPSA